MEFSPRNFKMFLTFNEMIPFTCCHALRAFTKGPFIYYVWTIFGFLDPSPPTSAYVMYEWSQTVWLLAFLACVEWSILLIFLAFKVFISAISIISIIPKLDNWIRSMYFIHFHSTIFRSFISIKSYPVLLKRIVLFLQLVFVWFVPTN